MGGAILLAVIFSIVKHPVQIPVRGEFILLRLETSGPPHLMGLRVRTPAGLELAAFETPTAASPPIDVQFWRGIEGDADPRHVLYVEIRDPMEGAWLLQPYMADYRGASEYTTITDVAIWTKDGRLVCEEPASPLNQIDSPAHPLQRAYRVLIGED